MTDQEKDRIECAIRHIKTSVDIDSWAMEMAIDALEKQVPKKAIGEHYAHMRCPSCNHRIPSGAGLIVLIVMGITRQIIADGQQCVNKTITEETQLLSHGTVKHIH